MKTPLSGPFRAALACTLLFFCVVAAAQSPGGQRRS